MLCVLDVLDKDVDVHEKVVVFLELLDLLQHVVPSSVESIDLALLNVLLEGISAGSLLLEDTQWLENSTSEHNIGPCLGKVDASLLSVHVSLQVWHLTKHKQELLDLLLH